MDEKVHRFLHVLLTWIFPFSFESENPAFSPFFIFNRFSPKSIWEKILTFSWKTFNIRKCFIKGRQEQISFYSQKGKSSFDSFSNTKKCHIHLEFEEKWIFSTKKVSLRDALKCYKSSWRSKFFVSSSSKLAWITNKMMKYFSCWRKKKIP